LFKKSTNMHILSSAIAVGALLPAASAYLAKRILDDPVGTYLTEMCYPLWSNATLREELKLEPSDGNSWLVNSPFPCEQELFIMGICEANGTTVIDFLAEQECLCGGSFFDAVAGCSACYSTHGYQPAAGVTPKPNEIASISAAE